MRHKLVTLTLIALFAMPVFLRAEESGVRIQ